MDDVNCSFKCAHLSKYLQDTIEPFHPSLDVDSNSNVSLISTISSVSSVLSLDSDDEAPSQHSLSYSFSDIEEMYFVTTQAKIDKLRREITTQGFVMVDESIREIERSEDEDRSEKVKDDICQLLNQRTASQRRDKSCAPSH